MRRLHRLVAPLVFLALVGLFANGPGLGTAAQDGTPAANAGTLPATTVQQATPAAAAGHPVVGAWLGGVGGSYPDPVAAGDAEEQNFLVTFAADGTLAAWDQSIDPDRRPSPGHGAWVATGDRTAAVTFVVLLTGASGEREVVTFRGTAEVDEARDGLSMSPSFDVGGPGGAVIEQDTGPVGMEATRIGAGAAAP